MTPWLALALAGAMEIAWALGLKYSDGFSRFWPSLGTAVAIPLSFMFLALSLRATAQQEAAVRQLLAAANLYQQLNDREGRAFALWSCGGAYRFGGRLHEATPAVTMAAAPAAQPGNAVRYVRSADLFAGAREVVIEHEHHRYRLKMTSRGGLILNK